MHRVFLEYFTYAPEKQKSVSWFVVVGNIFVTSRNVLEVAFFVLLAQGYHCGNDENNWSNWKHLTLQEMIEIVREHVVHMLHTRDGARVAMHCLWYGTAKVTNRFVTVLWSQIENRFNGFFLNFMK